MHSMPQPKFNPHGCMPLEFPIFSPLIQCVFTPLCLKVHLENASENFIKSLFPPLYYFYLVRSKLVSLMIIVEIYLLVKSY